METKTEEPKLLIFLYFLAYDKSYLEVEGKSLSLSVSTD